MSISIVCDLPTVHVHSRKMKIGIMTGDQIYLKFFWALIIQALLEIISFRTEKTTVLIEAYLYVVYSGSPALSKESSTASRFFGSLKKLVFRTNSNEYLGLNFRASAK